MNRLLPLSLLGVVAALTLAASAASAAPSASLLFSERSTAAEQGLVDKVHYRRWHHGHGWHRFRRCHWERVCWWNRWGHRRCELVRRCHPRHW